MSDYSEPEIKFVSDKMRAFSDLIHGYLIYGSDAVKSVFEAFENKDISEIMHAFPTPLNSETFAALKEIKYLADVGDISDISSLQEVVSKHLNSTDAERMNNSFGKAFEAYDEFYGKSLDNIAFNIATLEKGQVDSQSGYKKELSSLYVFFDIPKDLECRCYINPFPGKTLGDGVAAANGVSQNYSLQRTEDDDNYIGSSNLLKRKSSTPFHEATHFLFENSGLKEELLNPQNPGMKKVMDNLASYFEGNPQLKNNGRQSAQQNALSAINESLAVCSTALLNEKITGKPVPDGKDWYVGFEAANKLAPQVYPLYKEYITHNQKFDDNFFIKLSENMSYFKSNDKALEKASVSKIEELKQRCSASQRSTDKHKVSKMEHIHKLRQGKNLEEVPLTSQNNKNLQKTEVLQNPQLFIRPLDKTID